LAAPLVQSGAGALRPTHFRRYRFGSQTTVHPSHAFPARWTGFANGSERDLRQPLFCRWG